MRSLPVVAVVVIATATLSLTRVPLAAGSVNPDLRLDDFDFPDPLSNVCLPRCQNGGICTKRRCVCPAGWTGARCEEDINECNTNNGGCPHICTNTQGSRLCSCRAGFTLASDGRTCSAVCTEGCGGHGSCVGPQKCTCEEGWTGPTCGEAICTEGCGGRGSCVEPQKCRCEEGWTGTTCGEAVCLPVCQNGGTCTFPGHCACPPDWTGLRCGEPLCSPPCVHGSCGTDSNKSPVCHCTRGWTGVQCDEDVNECNTYYGGCAQICTNTRGSRVCSCRAGFTLASDGRNCQDINECNTNNGGCAHICTNTLGSHVCSCRSGYRLATYGKCCIDVNECNTNNGGCAHICTNVPGSRLCSCRAGFTLASDGRNCQEHLTVNITVDYTHPANFNAGLNEYRAASGPVRVTCIATGAGSGTISYQWSSTCRNCPFQSATASLITRAAVHSGDNGTHTCVATRGGGTASASIVMRIVGAGVHVFRGSPRGNHPNNGLVVSNSVGSGFRFRIFFRSDSMSANVGEIIGLNGNALSSNGFFAISPGGQTGEIAISNTVGSQSALTASQQGVYTCRIPMQNGVWREFNIGIYPSGFNTPPRITSLTSQPSSSSCVLTCTSTASPATTVTWSRNGQPVTIGGIYQMTQTVTNRAAATYDNVLTVNQPLASVLGSSFTCTVTNELGLDTSSCVQVTVNECETNNGGCAQICTDTVTSFQCSCRSGYTLATNSRSCIDINECYADNGGCAHICTNTPGSGVCSCRAGFTLASDGRNCQALCPDSTSIVNGMVTSTGNSVGNTATYTCDLGFELIGTETTTCIASFSPAPPVCRQIQFEFDQVLYSINEADGTATLRITKAQNTAQPVSVHFITQNGTAMARTDFTSILQVVTFDSSDTEVFVTVPIIDDDVMENTENFFGELRSNDLMIARAEVNIIDND